MYVSCVSQWESANVKRTNVLIIDDDPVVLAAYQAAFGDEFVVRAADSASGGFAMLQFFKADAVVLDLNMPGSSGLRWLDAARQLPGLEELPIIVVTGAAADSPEFVAALASGVHGVLSKQQWSPASLVAAVSWAVQHPRFSTLSRAA
jgi:CheY-like chemotaxis protein